MRFKFLTGDVNWNEYGGKFVSKKLNNGEFDYWLVLSVVNMHEATGNYQQDRYNVTIEAVSPQQAGKDNLDEAFGSCGFSDEDLERLENNPLAQVEALSDYGIFAVLWQKSGNNIDKLMREARKQARICVSFTFGFWMDRPGNRIGQTGWDLIQGQSVREFFASR